MLKKLFVTGLVVAAGLFVLSSTRLGSYGWTAWNKTKKAVKAQVPLEFEIERVRQQVAQLVPDMQKNVGKVADEMVAVENLRGEIAFQRKELDKRKSDIRVMADELKSGTERIALGGRTYSRDRIKNRLDADLKSCVRLEEEIKAREQTLEYKERALDVAREQIAGIKLQKQELETEIAKMEAEVKALRLAQSRSTIELDDSRLAHIKASLQEISNRLRSEKIRGDLEGQFSNDPVIKVEKTKSANDVVKEVEDYLGGDTKVATEVQK